MLCMKCGREIEKGHAFCDDCLAEMEKRPVSPNTVVFLPPNRDAFRRAPRRKEPTDGEKLALCRRKLRHTRIVVFALTICLLICVGVGVWIYRSQNIPALGQNYTVIPSTVATTAETEPTE